MRFYLIYGTIACLYFAYLGATGDDLFDIAASGGGRPKGPGVYHK